MISIKMAIILASSASFMVGVVVGNLSYALKIERDAKKVVQESPKEEEKKRDWKVIEEVDFDYDMDRDSVTLIKRSFTDDGIEATYVEYGPGKVRYFHCSREMHEKLVQKFREMLQKREEDKF